MTETSPAPRTGNPSGLSFDSVGGEAGALRWTVERARAQAEDGGSPYAAILVLDGRVVAFGVNTVNANKDVTGHAEVNAVRAASVALDRLDLSGALVFSSAEPCSLCRTVCHAAGIQTIVYATPRHMIEGALGPLPPSAARLRDAVNTALPGMVRLGGSDLTPEVLLAPYEPARASRPLAPARTVLP